MPRYRSIPVREEVFERLRRVKESLGFRSWSDLLLHLVETCGKGCETC